MWTALFAATSVAKRPDTADRTVEHARVAPIGRTERRSGITATLHWHRTPVTGALIFLFLLGLEPLASLAVRVLWRFPAVFSTLLADQPAGRDDGR